MVKSYKLNIVAQSSIWKPPPFPACFPTSAAMSHKAIEGVRRFSWDKAEFKTIWIISSMSILWHNIHISKRYIPFETVARSVEVSKSHANLVRSSKIKLFLSICKITASLCPNHEKWKIIDFQKVLIASYALGFSLQLYFQICVSSVYLAIQHHRYSKYLLDHFLTSQFSAIFFPGY